MCAVHCGGKEFAECVTILNCGRGPMSNRFENVTGLDKAVTGKGKQNEAMGELLEEMKVSFIL